MFSFPRSNIPSSLCICRCQCTCSDVPRRARVTDSCLDYHSRHHQRQALPSRRSSIQMSMWESEKSLLVYMPHQENFDRSLLPKMPSYSPIHYCFLSVYHMSDTAKQHPYCLKYFHRVRISVENDLELGRTWCLRNYQVFENVIYLPRKQPWDFVKEYCMPMSFRHILELIKSCVYKSSFPNKSTFKDKNVAYFIFISSVPAYIKHDFIFC